MLWKRNGISSWTTWTKELAMGPNSLFLSPRLRTG